MGHAAQAGACGVGGRAVKLDRDTAWRIRKIGLCVSLVVVAVGLVFAMEMWRPILEPVVKIIDAFAMRGRVAYDPSHYRLWEFVAIGSTAVVVGLAIWALFGKNPDRQLGDYLQTKLEIQARDHVRGLRD